MSFWIYIILAMLGANLLGQALIALARVWYQHRAIMLTKIERGNAAFEHLLNAQKALPPSTPNTISFPKKAE